MYEHVTFTREQLYDLVWSRPLSRIAEEYSISDVGLSKLCTRHGIPTPPRGYWAKLEAGRAPRRPELPQGKKAQSIILRVAASDQASLTSNELDAAIAELRQPDKRLIVSPRLRSPCRLVAIAKEALAAGEPDDDGILQRPAHCADIRVSQNQLSRALRIADALFKAFDSRGWETEVSNTDTLIVVGEDRIAITIKEELETIERTPKPDLSGDYDFHYNRRETVRHPSGILTIRLEEQHHLWGGSHRRRWRATKTKTLEERLNDVIIGVLRLTAAIRGDVAERRRRAALEEERQRERAAARAEQTRLREELERERSKLDALIALADRWRQCGSLRLFLDESERHGSVPELGIDKEGLKDWIAWGRSHADRIDPFIEGPRSILDDAARIEAMYDDHRGDRWL